MVAIHQFIYNSSKWSSCHSDWQFFIILNQFYICRTSTSLILMAAFATTLAQDLTVNCTFSFNNDYTCILENIVVVDRLQNVTISGDHLAGQTNADVKFVFIRNSNTPFMVPQVFNTFPNIVRLYIENCGVESFTIPSTVRLEVLNMFGNNITRLSNGTFDQQTCLTQFSARQCGIREIDENAFEGLDSLVNLFIVENQIEKLPPRVLHSLPNLHTLYLSGNLLRSIDADLLAKSTRAFGVYFDDNQIEQIDPQFVANLRNNLRFINLRDNKCISEGFSLSTDEDWNYFNDALKVCFNGQFTKENKSRWNSKGIWVCLMRMEI